MKAPLLAILCVFLFQLAFGQAPENDKAITKLINQYSEARETKDTVLLNNILTEDIDQLVSNGEWRVGIRVAIDGMMRSSTSNPGSRTLTIDKIRYLGSASAIADCRYEIKNPEGSERKMWSTFVVVKQKGKWRISAIRNMLPAG
ncbi:SgcJ/EcaC family oxidoreductase [Imperialibacter roseus]|uniref:SgcJ/EcaC family oxidoreductase n=1 Tax=Imperialibacter roseus TaxID=1324217 RepID=A0ABZ0IWV0_9BACT|nr:SgcJ/EcaC family oxidoreductase [Imperialibacter roseus]WOK09469.1 SgcJ/EcaC family oxidoreductase [Imperialibacter roseus]